MKKDRTVLYGALVLIGVYAFIQYQKSKKSESDESGFSNIFGARKFCNANNNFGLSGRECRKRVRRDGYSIGYN